MLRADSSSLLADRCDLALGAEAGEGVELAVVEECLGFLLSSVDPFHEL